MSTAAIDAPPEDHAAFLSAALQEVARATADARASVQSQRALRARARHDALRARAAALLNDQSSPTSVAGRVRAALAGPAAWAPSAEPPPPLEGMLLRADAALAAAQHGHTLAGWLRAASGRLYRAWGYVVFRALCWALGVPLRRQGPEEGEGEEEGGAALHRGDGGGAAAGAR